MSAAQVRFVEVAPGTPEIDFYTNNAGAAYGVGYQSFTSYLPVLPGALHLSAHRTGAAQPLTSLDAVLGGGRQYTVLLSRGPGGLVQRLYPDQDTPAPSGQIALRVLNEVEGPANLAVYVTPVTRGANANSATVLTVSAGAATGYVLVPAAGTYSVAAAPPGGSLNVPVAMVTLKAEPGAVRTVVFAGTGLPGGHGNVVGFALADADAP